MTASVWPYLIGAGLALLVMSLAFCSFWAALGYMARHSRDDVQLLDDEGPEVVEAVEVVEVVEPARRQRFEVDVEHGGACTVDLQAGMVRDVIARTVNRNGEAHVVTVREMWP